MTLTVHPIHPAVGAEIRGVDVSGLSDEEFGAIEDAWHRHAMVLVRGQGLTDDDLIGFSERLGELDPPPVNENGKTFVPDHPEIYVISNVVGADGVPIGSLGAGEAQWHTDMSYLPEPPDASMVYAIELPLAGGDTWFCGMEAALRALPPSLLRRVRDLQIKHDGTFNSAGYLRKGLEATDNPMHSVGTPHPIVCEHPVTGRPVLYLGRRRNAYVMGLALDESEALLDELWRYATLPENCYAHQWRVGDLVFWDNRSTMHRRDPFDAGERRILHRTQIKGQVRPRAYSGFPASG